MLKDNSQNSSLSQMAKFYRNLKTKQGTKLGDLQNCKPDFVASEENYNLLEEISDEQGFSVTYVDVEERYADSLTSGITFQKYQYNF